MKKYVTLGIMLSLLSGKRYSAPKLAEKYETSVKTIYRAIETLLEAGMPITCKQGKNGGYELVKESAISTSFFTINELSSFISFLKSSNIKPFENISNIDERLELMKDKKLATKLKEEALDFVIDTNVWGSKNFENKNEDTIKAAIQTSTKLLITYYDISSKTTKRIIHPYTMVYKTGVWYIYAYCEKRGAFRLFKLARIKNIELLDQKFIKEKIDIASKPWIKEFEENLEKIDIQLLCPSSKLADITEWLGENIKVDNICSSLCNENIDLNQNYKLITGTANFSLGLIHRLMQLGPLVKVVKPQKLKDALIKECLNIYSCYA